MTGPRPGRPTGPPRLLLVYVGALITADLAFGTALTPLLPRYAHLAGLSEPTAGILMGAYALGGIIGAVPGGVVAGRLGSRTAAQLGLAAAGAAGLVLGWSSSAGALTGARFVQGAAGACTWAAGLAWLSGATPTARRGEVLGTAMGFAAAGAVAGPAAGALAIWAGPGPAFTAAAAACAALIIAAWFLPAPQERGPRILLPGLRFLGDRGMSAGMLLTALGGMGAGGLDVLAPLRLSRLGATTAVLAGTWIAAGVLEMALSSRIGRISDRLGETAAVRLLLTAAAITLLAFPLLGASWWLAALLSAGLPAFGCLCVPGAALLCGGADRQRLHAAVAFGLGNLAWSGGQAVAAMAAGAAAQATADAVPTATLAGLCLLVSAAVPRGPRRPPEPAQAAAEDASPARHPGGRAWP